MASLGDAGHRCLTAVGPYSDDEASWEIYISFGGIFDSTEPVPIERVAVDNVGLCEMLVEVSN